MGVLTLCVCALGCSEKTPITIFIYARVDFGVFQYGKLGSSLKKMIFGPLVGRKWPPKWPKWPNVAILTIS